MRNIIISRLPVIREGLKYFVLVIPYMLLNVLPMDPAGIAQIFDVIHWSGRYI